MSEIYELIIIGGGPSGLTAAIYSTRASMNTLMIEGMMIGGQVMSTHLVENYPGYESISGPDLMEHMEKQAMNFGLNMVYENVVKVERKNRLFEVFTNLKNTYTAKSIIISTGSEPAKLGIKGEDKFRGRGVSYCATCDGAFFKDAIVGVVGGGNSACTEALFLTKFAKKVYIIHRRDQLRATSYLQKRVKEHEKIEIIWDTVLTEALGDTDLKKLKLQNIKTNVSQEKDFNGVFIYVGLKPNSIAFKDFVSVDTGGFIKVNENMQTSIPGVFAAGDIRTGAPRQIVTAASDGAIAALAVEKYLENQEG